jgi:hypothetical protein
MVFDPSAKAQGQRVAREVGPDEQIVSLQPHVRLQQFDQVAAFDFVARGQTRR